MPAWFLSSTWDRINTHTHRLERLEVNQFLFESYSIIWIANHPCIMTNATTFVDANAISMRETHPKCLLLFDDFNYGFGRGFNSIVRSSGFRNLESHFRDLAAINSVWMASFRVFPLARFFCICCCHNCTTQPYLSQFVGLIRLHELNRPSRWAADVTIVLCVEMPANII